MNEPLFEIEAAEQQEMTREPAAQALTTTGLNTNGDESPRGRTTAIAGLFNGQIAQIGGEVFIRDEGIWKLQTGHLKKACLNWWGTHPEKSGLWLAGLLQWAVDPNGEGEAVYFARDARGDWEPVQMDVRNVLFATGSYNIVTRKFTSSNRLIFGPLIQCPFNDDIMEACRTKNYAAAPEQFRTLIDMINFALGNDEATVKYFQQVCAQILRPHAGWNHFVHIHGESGARKTTIMRAILNGPCGPSGFNELAESMLAEHKFARSGLVNRIANLSNDSAVSPKFVNFIKEITSGVLITEKKFIDVAPSRLTAKLFATMNVPQNYNDNSLGIENRIIVFKFKERSDNDRSATGMQWMEKTWYTDECRAWITHWLLAGLESCVDANGKESAPTPSKIANDWKNDLLNEASPVRNFCQKYLIVDKEAFTSSASITDLAIETGFCSPDERSRAIFGDNLKKYISHRYKIERKRKRTSEGQTTGYTGIKINDKE